MRTRRAGSTTRSSTARASPGRSDDKGEGAMRVLCGLLFLTLLLEAGPAVAGDLPEIVKRGHMVAATSGNLPPVTFLNDKNELVGYDIEVGRFIARHIG